MSGRNGDKKLVFNILVLYAFCMRWYVLCMRFVCVGMYCVCVLYALVCTLYVSCMRLECVRRFVFSQNPKSV